jgi:heat shock protein HtpX
MMWLKRISFFFLVNIAMIAMISIVLRITGLDRLAMGGGNFNLFLFCLLWGMGGAFISLWASKWMAKTFYGVKIIEQSSTYSSYSWLVQSIHQMATKAGLEKMPRGSGSYQSAGCTRLKRVCQACFKTIFD